MMPITEAVSLGLAAGTATAAVIAAPLLIRARRLTARLRGELAAATEYGSRLAERQRVGREELEHLTDVRLPAVLEGVPEADVPKALYAAPDGDPEAAVLAARHEALLTRTAAAIRARKGLEESGRAAFLVMADRIQVMALAQQQGLDVLEQSAEDPVLMAGLMRADHAAAQLARQAQTMKVLCGAWPGRQWPEAVSLLDVVRGAQSRILEYQRVRVQGARDAAVEPRAVEALIHAVAELLDNATRYSPPTVTVLVGIRPVHSGAVIEIDDGGLGMTEQALAEAEVRLGGGAAAEGRGLGAKPQLGLAAVGMLARRYGFSVKLDSPSAYGGVRAVVLVPSALLTQGPTAPATPAPPRAPGLREQAERDRAERDRTERDRAERDRTEREQAERDRAEREQAEWEQAERTRRTPPPADAPEHRAPSARPGPVPAQHTRPEPAAGQDGITEARARNDRYDAEDTAGPYDVPVIQKPATQKPATPKSATPEPPAPEPPAITPGGLPRRRSRRAAAGPVPGSAPRTPAPEPVRSPQQAAAFMSSLQAGTRLGREEAAAAAAPAGAGTAPEAEAAEAARTPQATMAAEATGPVVPSDVAAPETLDGTSVAGAAEPARPREPNDSERESR
ncbi:ATP-binding protein [Streptomyces huiliensis]|uniref:ATP-binding protein n=1 Tax=Streptomyces huiliensis TaxID=2876027 RepID=UPI001CBC7221|nr:ATP-binding protein [Streptomyces huiliensis]MBZ4320320.1 hypothetical protein [Streptomyces huiliensis]